MKTLYLSDLDGTLLQRDEQLSDFTVKTINRLIEKGMMFSYATARSLSSASKVTGRLDIRLPVIINNGVFIKDPITGENLSAVTFSEEERAFAKEWFKKHGIFPIVYAFDGGAERVTYLKGSENEGKRHYLSSRKGDKRFRQAENTDELFRGEVYYYTCIGEKEELAPVFEHFAKDKRFRCVFQQEIYRPEYWCEIMPAGASKATALQRLKEMLNCDKIITFGDSANDIPMFEVSDECYAVENAVPELKEVADAVILSNTEDGVARWLCENFKL
ncbi:cof family hydrolase [[Clostridium] cellulosi]|uniref:Cof family hydrolase n=1 Tax=[Clostridium] cellulosi TaxID=29343 RepID=A0A078KIP7_9FIRM|nr:cof family hydrolase [[Clostridium] cellulosi]